MIEIMAADVSAAERLSGLHAHGFEAPWSESEIATLLKAGAVALLAIEGPAPVGFVMCRIVADEAEILTIVTDPANRRRGVASRLLSVAEDVARQCGATVVFLEVAVDNASALTLYFSRGFREVGRRARYYATTAGPVDALILRLDLNR